MRTSSGVIVCSNPGSQVLSYRAAATARGCSVNTLANSAVPLNSGIDGLGRQQTRSAWSPYVYKRTSLSPNQAPSSLVVPHRGMVNLTSTTRIK
jgi:hypothetical protein